MKEKYFWVSWFQRSEDHRPLTYPPNKNIIGWWCSGYDAEENSILCAFISADDKEDAEKSIKQDWPEWTEWRFFEDREKEWAESDRFPLSDWMRERVTLKS